MGYSNGENRDLIIRCAEDCGNSPKKQELKKLHIAVADNNTSFIMDSVAEQVTWNIVGHKPIKGKDRVKEALKQEITDNVTEIELKNIITHGKTGAVDGTLLFGDGKVLSFCNIFNFTGAGKNSKIIEIASYVI